MSWETAIVFQKNEQKITAWYGDREWGITVAVQGTTQNRTVQRNGFLVLTNLRILFFEEQGVLGKSYHITLTFWLENLQGISMQGRFKPLILLKDQAGTYGFHLNGVGKNEFDPFRSLIIEQSQKRIEEIESYKRKDKVQIVLDFSTLRDYMEKGGLVLQKTACPNCGAPLPLPNAGKQIICEH